MDNTHPVWPDGSQDNPPVGRQENIELARQEWEAKAAFHKIVSIIQDCGFTPTLSFRSTHLLYLDHWTEIFLDKQGKYTVRTPNGVCHYKGMDLNRAAHTAVSTLVRHLLSHISRNLYRIRETERDLSLLLTDQGSVDSTP